MKKKFKVTLVVFLVVVLGCFSETFAATKVNTKLEKNVQVSMNKNLLDNATDDGAEIGTSNLNGTAENSAKIGDQITSPEIGWRRYDDNNSNIKYIGTGWYTASHAASPCYKVNAHGTSALGDGVEFKFVGNKIRILGDRWSNKSKDIKIYIDNKAENISAYIDVNNDNLAQRVMYDNKSLSNGEHVVKIVNNETKNFVIDAIDIDSTGRLLDSSTNIAEKLTLNKTTDSLTVGQADTLIATVAPDNAANKTIKWTSSDENIVKVDQNGKITAVAKGTATITATTQDGSNLSASCAVTVNDPLILNIEPEKTKINLNDTVSADLTIDNIQDIAAEDVRIKYDSTKLNFLGYDEVDGIKLVKDVSKDGELRVIIASKGKANVINAKKILLKLKFKGIAAGDALVDVTKGRVSDGITKEWDLTDAQCGQATITIQKIGDVDNSGEYTLLDLGIDARHMGEDPSTLPQYNTDQDGNNTIDDTDLTEIGKYILENPSYAPNNIK